MNKTKAVIFASIALSGLATSVIMPILVPLIRELRLSESQGGWMISIGSIAMAALASAWGMASDRFGRKPVMMAGFAGLFASYVVYTAVIWKGLAAAMTGSTLFIALVGSRALVGGFLPAVPAGAQALMADNTMPEERSSGMAIISAASGVGLVIGPALGGLVALRGLIWPLVLTTVLCLIALVIVLYAVPKAPRPESIRHAPVSLFTPELFPWLAAGVLTMCSVVTIQISAGFYFQDRLGLTTAETGPLLAIALTLVGVSLFFTQVMQVRVLRWNSHRMVLAGASCWLVALPILLFTASMYSYFLAYVVMGAGAGLLMPGYMSGASLAVPADRQGAVAGFSTATQGIGGIVAPIASTTLYEVDKSLPFWAILLLMCLLIALFGLPINTQKPS
ncbi:MFS transporter [Shinella sp. BYT-45]|uniref:MFS transporter n=1 Tax=Shinella sp. BYT-45 TaxID=3377377 RepID=UPI003980E0A4